MLQITEVFRDQLIQYLATRPYSEVGSAIPTLQQLPKIAEGAPHDNGAAWEHVCRNMLSHDIFDVIKAAVSQKK